MVGDPDRHGLPAIAEVEAQVELRTDHHRQCTGPKRLGNRLDLLGHFVGQSPHSHRIGDQHRRRHVPAALFGVQQSLHSIGIEGVGPDSVDGIGGEHDAQSVGHGSGRRVDRRLPIEADVEDLRHGAHPARLAALTPVTNRGRPARS
ncbi:hypothetical protein SDC9_206689 [bioreactor metagenome]|uniref:Uncharacterized protein n=1 Tax=bioreactor metagenome TaxID=1076179 RepID=A0A645J765_9ZZZZ